MKKLKYGILFLSACIIAALLCPITTANGADGSADPIIADHNNATLADLVAIPVEWINKAKSDLHIYYNHTSHGSQVADGMTGLVGFRGDTYAWNSSGSNGALHLADTYSTDLGNSDWPSITRNYLNSHTSINIVMWSWCGQVSTATEADINNYLSNMSQLEKDYPNVKFVYMTGHTDGTGTSGNLHVRNEQIRQYCRTNNKILFDFADIESYDPDGNYYLDKGVNDECYYDSDGDSSRESNWATAWQNSHTENVDWYRCGSAHSQPINANMKAYAAWYLWARLAGWDGTAGGGGTSPDIDTTAPSVPASLTGSAVSQTEVILNWTASTDNIAVAGYRIYRNGTEIGTSPTNSYSDTGLTAGTQYAYRVSAYDAAGNQSAQCAAVNITTQSAPQSGASVSQLTARHYEGQTILTWNEIPEVTAAVSSTMTIQQVRDVRASFSKISYRIYRSNSPITSVAGLSPIKTVGVLTGWDDEFYGLENNNIDNNNCPRFVVDKDTDDVAAAPVSAGTAVSAYNPASAGTAYYAVTVVRDGIEETQISSGNTVTVNETEGQGIPILQKVETVEDYFYTDGISTHYYYTRWESPPNSNVQGMPIDYKVIVPESYVPGKPTPVNLSFHAWGSNMHLLQGWWFNFNKGTISITTNQIPYDWWTGYHEKYGIGERSQQNWASGVVRPYTQNRLNSFFDWAASKWSLDRSRTIASGVSMGGSGSIMYGIRNPDRVAWVHSWVGVHVPAESPTFRSSYQLVYGDVDWQIKYQDGVTPAFSYFDDDWYLRNHISDETPFITFSNGKDDSDIGWSQAVKFVKALQDTKRPHIFYWGQSGHKQRTLNPPDINGNLSESENPIDIRVDQSLPAFTKCSLDDDPGNGDINNGDASGQINAYMFWKTEDIVDTQNRWEMTIGVVQTAPAQSCTVSLTPRRLQNFDPVPGKVYRWTNTSLSNNTQIQSGTVTCDSYGLLTIDNLAVNLITSTGGGNRIAIFDDGTVPANNQPVLAAIGARTVKAGETLTITVNASDSDPGDMLVYSVCTSPSGSLPQGASFDAASRTFTWTPGNDQSGDYTLRFTVSDGKQIDYEDVVITVSNMSDTPPQGRNVRVTTVAELRSAITNAQDGDTILIADGEYRNGNPLILDNVDDIVIRSESNDPTRVTLRGRTSFTGTGSYDELDDILRIGDCNNVRISGLTLTQAHGYGIKLELDSDSNPNAIYIENCRFIDIGTRHIKGTKDSNSSTKRIKGGAIRNCYFENTVTPPSTGGWLSDGNYIGAIDMMSLDDWVIEDNEFRNIHGNSGEGRSAIMIWYFSENLTIQRNRIINCDRGITLGLPGADLGGGRHVEDTIVRNNFILPGSKTGYQSDAGIECSDVDNVKIYNNTIWRLNSDYNGRGIRFIQNIANTQMVNNLVYGRLVFDNDLTISRNEGNISGNISSGYVTDVSTGDLHLTASAANAINNGVQLAEVTDDIDGNARGTTPDIGADEYVTSGDGTTNPGGGGVITSSVDGNIPDTTATTPSATITSSSGTTATQSLAVSGGTVIAAANAEQLNSAMKQAAPGSGGIRSVALTLLETKNASTYQQNIPADIFRKGTAKEHCEIKLLLLPSLALGICFLQLRLKRSRR